MIHIALGVFAGIVAASWFLGWCAARKQRRITRRGMEMLYPHLYPAKSPHPVPCARYEHTAEQMHLTRVSLLAIFIGISFGVIAGIIHNMP